MGTLAQSKPKEYKINSSKDISTITKVLKNLHVGDSFDLVLPENYGTRSSIRVSDENSNILKVGKPNGISKKDSASITDSNITVIEALTETPIRIMSNNS